MKQLLTTLFLSILSLSAFAQNSLTKVEFTPAIWDFGAIREVDGAVTYTFTYRNTGNAPYVINDISTSCGCTTPSYNHSPLMPGENRQLQITFDPINQPGRIEKTILIRGNVENGTTVLKIRATVEPRPRTVEDDYPIPLTDGVRLQDVVLDMGSIPNTKTSIATLGIINTGPQPVNITVNPAYKSPWWATIAPQELTLSPAQRSVITVTTSPQGETIWGRHAFPIALLVNGRAQFINITASAIFIEDLNTESSKLQPRASLSNYFYHFSTVKKNSDNQYKFTIKNSGTGVLNIRHFDHSDKVDVSSEKMTLKPAETTTVIVKLDTKETGAQTEMIRIITNDPLKPVQEFRVMANIID